MKKIFFVIGIMNLFSVTAGAQDLQKEKNDAMKDKVVAFFNAQNADSLYSLAGEAFKKQLSLDNFKAVCQNNLFPLGNIKETVFEKIDKGVSKYKTTFDGAILSMYLSLDAVEKFQAFLFQPYKKEITGPVIKSKTDNTLQTDLDKKVEDILQPFMFQSKTVGLSIGIIKDGKKYYYNYGETKKGNSQIPSSANLYEIGSITKTFTGIILAKAIIEKKINLNDPVNKYLPKNIPVIKFGNDTLKIVHLTNHTSGLPPLPDNFGATDLINPYKDYDEKKLLEYLKHATISRKPGEKMEYCNLGVGLLGNILERVNKMPFEKMVNDFITSAFEMLNTKQLLTKKDSSLFMQGYNESILPNSQWDFKALAAAGCIRSNITDMLQYATANCLIGFDTIKNDVLKKAIVLSHQPTFKDAQQQIGLGWFILNEGGGEVLFHNGGTGGYRSFLSINPATKNAVVILSNTAEGNDEIGFKISGYLDK